MTDPEIQEAAERLLARRPDPAYLLAMVREFVDMDPDKQAPNQLRELRIFFRALDICLSRGDPLPNAWRSNEPPVETGGGLWSTAPRPPSWTPPD